MIAAGMAVAVALSTSSAPASRSGLKSDCTLTSTGLIPLTDMARLRYHGYRGGLYPGGRNRPTAVYLRKGLAASRKVRRIDGKIVLLSIGMSNATAEFGAFKRVIDRDPAKNPNLTIVDGAQDGWDARRVRADSGYWDLRGRALERGRCLREPGAGRLAEAVDCG